MSAARLGAIAVLALVTGLTACNDPDRPAPRADATTVDSPNEPRPSTAPSRQPTPTLSPESGTLTDLPAVPTLRSAAALTDQITRVEAVLRDPDAAGSDVRRAGQFEQLAARVLARAPADIRRDVVGRLTPGVEAKTRAHVEAATLLDAMTSPQPELPPWRIVEPPPPEELLGHYRAAGREIGVPWNYLAAIHLVETRMGRIRGVSTAGARGPMQFLPTTWDLYGEGGDIQDPGDAILAAARLLRANGAPGDMSEAVWHYNPSDNYVGAVTAYAEQLERSPRAYYGYWHWRVLYKHVRGTYVLDHGYPRVRARLLVAG